MLLYKIIAIKKGRVKDYDIIVVNLKVCERQKSCNYWRKYEKSKGIRKNG
jgi:hypothetical protein